MLAPISPVQADAEALFTRTLQPIVDAAATAESSGVSIVWVVGGMVVLGLVGLVGCSLWRDRPAHDVPATRSPSIPFSPVPMTRSLLLLAAVLVAAPAFAQTHAEAMARLAPYAGSYVLDGAADVLDSPSDDGGTFDGTLVVSPILGGHFQQWDWEMTMRSPDRREAFPVHLRFVTTYDSESGDYAIWRFDSRDVSNWAGPGGHDVNGRLRFDGDALVMAWPTANPEDPSKTGTFRNTVRPGAGGIEVVTNVQLDDGSPTVAIATTRAVRR